MILNRRPAFVTETDEPPPWTDCTWASVVMGIDYMTDGQTILDREKLRIASGDRFGGSNFGDVEEGLWELARIKAPEHSPNGGLWLSAPQAWELLKRGYGLVAQGSMKNMGHYWRRWSPNFDGYHCVWVQGMGREATWWMDPLGRGSYNGEWISRQYFFRYLTDLSPVVYVMPIKPPPPPARETNVALNFQRGTMFPVVAVIKKGAKVYDRPGGALEKTLSKDEVWPYAGYPIDEPDWRIIVKQTPMDSGGPHLKGLYVDRDSIAGFEPNAAYVNDKAAERIQAAQPILDQLEKVLR